jgi:membrane protease subunit (stomatin/prohibitin family)
MRRSNSQRDTAPSDVTTAADLGTRDPCPQCGTFTTAAGCPECSDS